MMSGTRNRDHEDHGQQQAQLELPGLHLLVRHATIPPRADARHE
jgi:hypothetical protein